MYDWSNPSDAEEAFLGGDKGSTKSFDPLDRKVGKCRRLVTNKYIVGGVLLVALLAVLSVILLGIILTPGDVDTSSAPEICYIYPACTTEQPPNAAGFTNSTGYTGIVENPSNSCCDACLPGTNATVCFDQNGSCSNSTGDGDYDFLLLDEMWIPQFCRALSNSYDPTLSHVEGMKCDFASNRLSIHGLWPNYVDGYPQCCNASGNLKPLDPTAVEDWDIYPVLEENWYDPTTSSECSTCYLLNHEWEKHGNCFSPGDPSTYFSTGLQLRQSLDAIDDYIAGLSGSIVNTSVIEDLYAKKSNVICDSKDPQANSLLEEGIGILLEAQTCWSRELTQVDCPPAFVGSVTYPCPERVFLPAVAT